MVHRNDDRIARVSIHYMNSGRRPTFFRGWDECRTLSGYALDVYPFADDIGTRDEDGL